MYYSYTCINSIKRQNILCTSTVYQTALSYKQQKTTISTHVVDFNSSESKLSCFLQVLNITSVGTLFGTEQFLFINILYLTRIIYQRYTSEIKSKIYLQYLKRSWRVHDCSKFYVQLPTLL